MKEAAAGNLDLKCEIDSDDEFGELSDMFNNMMNIISTNYNQLSESKKQLEANELELKKNYAHIEQLAYHDGLTGLFNRVAFMKFAYDILHNNGSQLSARHAIFFYSFRYLYSRFCHKLSSLSFFFNYIAKQYKLQMFLKKDNSRFFITTVIFLLIMLIYISSTSKFTAGIFQYQTFHQFLIYLYYFI